MIERGTVHRLILGETRVRTSVGPGARADNSRIDGALCGELRDVLSPEDRREEGSARCVDCLVDDCHLPCERVVGNEGDAEYRKDGRIKG